MSASASSGRTTVVPPAKRLARQSIAARTTSSVAGGPCPARWSWIWLRLKRLTSSGVTATRFCAP